MNDFLIAVSNGNKENSLQIYIIRKPISDNYDASWSNPNKASTNEDTGKFGDFNSVMNL